MSLTANQKIRIVTAASLFDGHDVAINIMRRILQSKGAEIIHLGHNRSVAEIVECAIEEDVQGIDITSYQCGHLEFFKYMKDLLDENEYGHIKIFGEEEALFCPQKLPSCMHTGLQEFIHLMTADIWGLKG
jgi:methylmalonyl-CoA mutase